MRTPTLYDLCERAPIDVLDAFLRRLLTVRPTRGTLTAYATASRVRARRRSLPA